MKKVVIAGSSSLQEKVQYWKTLWKEQGFFVIDYPAVIPEHTFLEDYPKVHKDFYKKITEADVLFIMNEDKNGIVGYVGAETFAELTFGVIQNSLYGKSIEVLLLQMPEKKVQSYDEIDLWLKLGWLKLYEENPKA